MISVFEKIDLHIGEIYSQIGVCAKESKQFMEELHLVLRQTQEHGLDITERQHDGLCAALGDGDFSSFTIRADEVCEDLNDRIHTNIAARQAFVKPLQRRGGTLYRYPIFDKLESLVCDLEFSADDLHDLIEDF